MNVVKTRKDHICRKCGKTVASGELALTESTRKYRGGWNYYVCCEDCAKKHLPSEYSKFTRVRKSKSKKRKAKNKRPYVIVKAEVFEFDPAEASWFNGGTK